MPLDICPWLGMAPDRRLRYAEPSEAHLCYAQKRPAGIDLDHQATVCLGAEHPGCRYYVEPPPPELPAPLVAAEDEVGPPPRRALSLRRILWLLAAAAAVLVAYSYGAVLFRSTPSPTATVSPSPSATGAATAVLAETATPTRSLGIDVPTLTPTPLPGGAIYTLSPDAAAAGWVASDEARGNHLGDSYLYTGVFDGVIYHGIFQLDLSRVPRGAALVAGVLELSGLDGRRLGATGTWEVRVLAREADEGWGRVTYQDVHNTPPRWSLSPALAVGDLIVGRTTAFVLSREQLQDLEQRLLDEHYAVSFRIDGPFAGENSVFAWDGGYGPATRGAAPRLWLSVGAPPQTPLPTGTPPFVVVTSTPTPANVVTAMARGQTATAAATAGQPTPTSIYQWTATPPLVVTNTPTPASQTTADWQALVATAVAFTTGTFTPTPEWLWTATPTAVSIPEAELTPTPTPPPPLPTPGLPEALRGQVLFRSDRSGAVRVWTMDAEGRGVALLTAEWPYEVAAGRESLSPDGQQVVIAGKVENQPALLVQPAGGPAQPLVVLETGQVSSPVWSPRGDLIAFVHAPGGVAQVWVVQADGRDWRRLTPAGAGSATHPSFSPDGTYLAYAVAEESGRRQVWLIQVDGTGARNLSDGGHDEWDPVWAK